MPAACSRCHEDDNSDSATVHAARFGPVIEVLWTHRTAETGVDAVEDETESIDPALEAALARVADTLAG